MPERDAEWARAASEGTHIERILSFWTNDAVVLAPGSSAPGATNSEMSLTLPGRPGHDEEAPQWLAHGGLVMAWRLDGTYFENCSCEVGCPCTVADFSAPADHERCRFLMAFHVDSGKVDDVDVSGLTVGVFGDTPAMMVEGNWKVGLFMDSNASAQQGAKLASVFSGQIGGPMAGLAPLITEMLGMESASIEYRSDGRHHSVKIGDGVAIEVDDVSSPLDPAADAPKVTGVHHPAGASLTVARSTASRISAFGYDIALVGKSGFSAPFSWAG